MISQLAACNKLFTMMVPVLVILAFSPTCYGTVFSIEAEQASIYKGKEMFRSAASGGITVNLVEGDYIEWTLATSSKCNVTIVDVRYSNDGLSDTIELLLGEVPIGSFRTLEVSNEGKIWNVFRSSGIVGEPISLSAGQHTLMLIMRRADKLGVEIDKVTLNSSCMDVRYSNVGLSDTIELLLGEVPIGSFRTLEVSNEGKIWNVFRSSGTVGKPVSLSAGKHISS